MTVAAASTTMKSIAAINVYKKVTIVRRPSDTVSYEDSEGNIKTVKDLGEVTSAAAVRVHVLSRCTWYRLHFLTHIFQK
jgi:hypothetical protein